MRRSSRGQRYASCVCVASALVWWLKLARAESVVASSSGEDTEVEVVVSGAPIPVELASSSRRLSASEVSHAPGAMGDAFRAIDMLPGVAPLVSGVPYFQLRGAPLGTVGYYVDDVRVPLIFHYGLGPSVLQPSFLGGVQVTPGGYPASMGGWIGGVVVATTAPPPSSLDRHGSWNARLYDAAAIVEDSFMNGQGQVRAGARYAYPGLVASLLQPDLTVGYWDYQLQSSYLLGSDSELQVFWFGASDYLDQELVTQSGTRIDRELLKLSFHRLDVRYATPVKQGADFGPWRTPRSDHGGHLDRTIADTQIEHPGQRRAVLVSNVGERR